MSNMTPTNGSHGMLDQQHALDFYLDALLGDAPPPAEVSQEQAVPPQLPPLEAEGGEETAHQPQMDVRPVKGVNDQADTHIRVQLFEAGGLTLAVPVDLIGQQVSGGDAFTPIPGHAPLIAGERAGPGQAVRVIDTAHLVLPAERAAQLQAGVADRCRHLLVMKSGGWALGCSAVGDIVDLAREEVTWRSESSSRLWLCGTANRYRCALLDVAQIDAMLAAWST